MAQKDNPRQWGEDEAHRLDNGHLSWRDYVRKVIDEMVQEGLLMRTGEVRDGSPVYIALDHNRGGTA